MRCINRLSFFVYDFCLTLLLPVLIIRLFWRSLKMQEYRQRILERFGIFTYSKAPGGIWVHAVSVGESMAAIPMILKLRELYPDIEITVTTTTPTGSARIVNSLGRKVFHTYVPYDISWMVKKFLHKIKPSLLIIMETEIWPNIIAICQNNNIPVVLANGRMSAKSMQSYKKFFPWIKHSLNSLTKIAAQEQNDYNRYQELGARDNLTITGNLKFDLKLPLAQIQAGVSVKTSWLERPVWIAASTHSGEEELVLAAHRQLLSQYPNLLLVLVPRHPDRFAAVAKLLSSQNYSYTRRSSDARVEDVHQVLLGDTMGEMAFYYSLADVAFVGGSLVPIGGHNLLEPASCGIPVVTGPNLRNFSFISEKMLAMEAITIVNDTTELAQEVENLLANGDRCQKMRRNSELFLQQNQGALDRLIAIIKQLLDKPIAI